ncbi:DUF374 domain-containing protein [bacterium]|nr:DUF374 domain-containing protein [bacterium]
MKYFFLHILSGRLFPLLLKIWFRTLRFQYDQPLPENRHILGFWHQDIFSVLAWVERGHQSGRYVGLVSASDDGAMLSRIMRRLKFSVIQASTPRQKYEAMLALRKATLERSVLITPDGPRGPARKVKRGISILSRMTGLPVVSLRVQCHSAWRLKSWDRFVIPKPFSVCAIEMCVAESIECSDLTQSIEDFLNGRKTRRSMEKSAA